MCSAPVSNPLYYNYSKLRERVICEALTPFLSQMVQILCPAASGDDERGFDSVPTVNDVLQWIAEKDYLENPTDRGALWATVLGVSKSWT